MGNSRCLDSGFGGEDKVQRAGLYDCIPLWQFFNNNQVWWLHFFGNPYPPNPVDDGVNFQIQRWSNKLWCLESSSFIQGCDHTLTKQTWRMERITGKLDSKGNGIEIVYIISDPPPFNKTKHAQVERK